MKKKANGKKKPMTSRAARRDKAISKGLSAPASPGLFGGMLKMGKSAARDVGQYAQGAKNVAGRLTGYKTARQIGEMLTSRR